MNPVLAPCPVIETDLELLDRWCAGDRAAGNALFKRHFESVYRFFEAKIFGEADELVQDTFLQCVRSRDRFRRQSSFRTFLFSVARHVLHTHWRRCAGQDKPVDVDAISLAALTTTIGTRLAQARHHSVLLLALRKLPLSQQLLLELHYWEDMNGEALAEIFDIAPATTRSRLFRARQSLREQLERMDDCPDLSKASVHDFDQWARSLHGR